MEPNRPRRCNPRGGAPNWVRPHHPVREVAMHRVLARRIVVILLAMVGLVGTGGILGVRAPAGPVGVAGARTVATAPADRLAESITRAQEHLRRVPGDWVAWAGLGIAYVEQA